MLPSFPPSFHPWPLPPSHTVPPRVSHLLPRHLPQERHRLKAPLAVRVLREIPEEEAVRAAGVTWTAHDSNIRGRNQRLQTTGGEWEIFNVQNLEILI